VKRFLNVTFFVYLACVLAFIGVAIYVWITKSGDMRTKMLLMLLGGLAFLHLTIIVSIIFRIKLPAYLHIYIFLMVVASIILGKIFKLYENNEIFDKALHGASGAVLTMLGFTIGFLLAGNKFRTFPLLFITIFAFCFSLSLALVWEGFEFSVDSLVSGQNMQRWADRNTNSAPYESGLVDTMWDSISHILGAILITIAGFFYFKKHPDAEWHLIEKKPRKASED